jgi:hypothetical protein
VSESKEEQVTYQQGSQIRENRKARRAERRRRKDATPHARIKGTRGRRHKVTSVEPTPREAQVSMRWRR